MQFAANLVQACTKSRPIGIFIINYEIGVKKIREVFIQINVKPIIFVSPDDVVMLAESHALLFCHLATLLP